MTLITPAEVFLPNTVPCGPLSTSIRSTSPRSPKPTELRGRYTPSITTPTDDSRPTLSPTVPMPRMRAVVMASFWVLVTVRPGTSTCMSLMSRTPVSWISCCGSDVSAIGTSCICSSRFCAVTIMVASVDGSSSAAWSACVDSTVSAAFSAVAAESCAEATAETQSEASDTATAAASVARCGSVFIA